MTALSLDRTVVDRNGLRTGNPRRHSRLTWLRLGGLFSLLCVRVNLGGCDDDKAAEFECEEVAQYVAHCCNNTSRMKCTETHEYELVTTSGCDHSPIHPYYSQRDIEPDFLPESARCVRSASCTEIKDAGLCDVSTFLNPLSCAYTPCADGSTSTSSCYSKKTCATPGQFGECTNYRPANTCAALARISCD